MLQCVVTWALFVIPQRNSRSRLKCQSVDTDDENNQDVYGRELVGMPNRWWEWSCYLICFDRVLYISSTRQEEDSQWHFTGISLAVEPTAINPKLKFVLVNHMRSSMREAKCETGQTTTLIPEPQSPHMVLGLMWWNMTSCDFELDHTQLDRGNSKGTCLFV